MIPKRPTFKVFKRKDNKGNIVVATTGKLSRLTFQCSDTIIKRLIAKGYQVEYK